VLARPDVPVFPPAGAVHLDLRLPSRDVADSHLDEVNLWDADRDAVRRAFLDTVGAIPEDHWDHLARPAWAAEKLAVREPRPADAVPDHPDFAWAVCLEHPALICFVGRWAEPHGAVEPYIRDADRSVG
jgi:hypothetical protein